MVWKRLRDAILFLGAVGSAAAAVVTILVWFGIRPKDVSMNVPHAGWLVLALAFFAISVTSSVIGWRRALRIPKVRIVNRRVTYDAAATYKTKIWPEFQNVTGCCLDVQVLRWKAGAIRENTASPHATLQVRRNGDWEPKDAAREVHVRDGEEFRLWIGAADAHKTSEVETARDRHSMGTIVLLLNGRETSIRM